MDSTLASFNAAAYAERIVRGLQVQQYLRPHQPLAEAVACVRAQTGFCPQADRRAIEALRLDPSRKIGRMKRCELTQLARTIHRIWRQSLDSARESQPV